MIKNKLESLNSGKFGAFKLTAIIDLPTVIGGAAKPQETTNLGGSGGPNDYSYTLGKGPNDNCATAVKTRFNPCGDTEEGPGYNVCH